MNELIGGFSAGTTASLTNVCLLPLYPGLIAILAGNAGETYTRRRSALLGAAVLAGVLTLMAVVGLIVVIFNAAFDRILPVLLPPAYALIIGLGVLLLAGKNPFARVQRMESPVFKNPLLTAYAYGLLLGPMTLGCTGPVFVAAFAYSVGIGEVINRLVFFLGFGLGFGWILILLPLLALPFQRRLTGWLTKNHAMMNRVAGLLLIATGIFGVIFILLPELSSDFLPAESAQYLYWLAAFGLIAAVGVMAYRRRDASLT